jgi:cell division protein FtsQ
VAEADVLAAAAVPPGTALAAVDTAGIASRVAALPGVAVAEVGRAWPGTVTVAVTERAPVAVTDTAEGPLPVDAAGVVYRGAVPPGVPRLLFPAAPDDPATGAALAVLAALPDGLRGEVTTVDVTVGGGVPQVELGLTDDRRARFGTAERAAEKASVLVVLLTQEGRVYDVSSPELPTVRS